MQGKKAQVALVACPSYERQVVEQAVARGLQLLGREQVWGQPQRILFKPNLLIPVAPEKAVTTHPEVVRACLQEGRALGARCEVGDSPMLGSLEKALRLCGMSEPLRELGATPADMSRSTVVHAAEGRRFRRFEVAEVATEVDLMVNLCKLKTHGIPGLTLSIKNLFGLIPGLEKSKWHLKAQGNDQMNELLVDFLEALTLRLSPGTRLFHVCDAVVGLEGEGPGAAGRPRPVGALVLSADPVALDAVASRLVGFDIEQVQTTVLAAQRGLGTADWDDIELLGDDLASLALAPGEFVPNRGSLRSGLPRWPMQTAFVRDRVVQRPRVDPKACTGCGECHKVCAAGAIRLEGDPRRAEILRQTCIRCYCCLEVCRYDAVHLSPRPLLARLLERWMSPPGRPSETGDRADGES